MKKIFALILAVLIIMSVCSFSVASAVKPYFYGEVNEDSKITIADATEIQRHISRIITLNDLRYKLADFNGDKKVTVADATEIQRYVAQIIPCTPRTDYVYSLVNIESVTPSHRSKRVQVGDTVTFTTDASIEYPIYDVRPLVYDYLIVNIEDRTQTLFENMGSQFEYAFDKAGLYRIDVIVRNSIGESDKHIFQYEVMESYPYDEYMFVIYGDKYYGGYQYNGHPTMPENCDIEFETVYSKSTLHDLKKYVANVDSLYSDYATIITSKEQYDTFVYVDNEKYDDEFFENNALVAIFEHLSCEEAEGYINALAIESDTMYISIGEYIDSELVSTSSPGCVLIAKVDKSDVENVTDIEWTLKAYTG